jgi:hypothetical protein
MDAVAVAAVAAAEAAERVAVVEQAEEGQGCPVDRYRHVQGRWAERRRAGTEGEVTEEEMQLWWREWAEGMVAQPEWYKPFRLQEEENN